MSAPATTALPEAATADAKGSAASRGLAGDRIEGSELAHALIVEVPARFVGAARSGAAAGAPDDGVRPRASVRLERPSHRAARSRAPRRKSKTSGPTQPLAAGGDRGQRSAEGTAASFAEHDRRLGEALLAAPFERDPHRDRDSAGDLPAAQVLGEEQHGEEDGEERLQVGKQRRAGGG